MLGGRGGYSERARARPETGSELTIVKGPGPWTPEAGAPQAEGQLGQDGAAVMTWDTEDASVAGCGGTRGAWSQTRSERGKAR